MFNNKVVLSTGWLLYAAVTVYAADIQTKRQAVCLTRGRPYCITDTCRFSETGSVGIYNLVCPSQESWCLNAVLDEIDAVIYEGVHAIPYAHSDIKQAVWEKKAVISAEYEELRFKAEQYFMQRQKELTENLNGIKKDVNRATLYRHVHLAGKRVKKYIGYLQADQKKYEHECVGAEVSEKAILCAMVGAHLKENISKMKHSSNFTESLCCMCEINRDMFDLFLYPPADEWKQKKCLDAIDQYIYREVLSIPYSHQDIQQASEENTLLVNRTRYTRFHEQAVRFINKRRSCLATIMKNKCDEGVKAANAHERIEQYAKSLDTVVFHTPSCLKVSISRRVMMCLLQGAYLDTCNNNAIVQIVMTSNQN